MNNQILTSQQKQQHLRQFQMQFLNRQSSRKHMQMQEQFLEHSMRKQSSRMLRSSSSKNKISHDSKSYGSNQKRNTTSRRLFQTENNSSNKENNKSNSNNNKQENNKVSAFKMQELQLLENQNRQVHRFQFSIISYFVEIIIAYGLTIGIFYLIKAGDFPYFQILFVIGLMNSITQWSVTNLVLITAGFMIIANNYLLVSILTYPSVLIVYLAVLIFNQEYKSKILFIFILILILAYGFAMIPGIYTSFSTDNKFTFYYIFPILMFIFRSILSAFYVIIGYSQYLYLQLPFFLMGLQYGVILTLDTSNIQYWYLMIMFTLQIINQRTQFTLSFMMSVVRSCSNYRKEGYLKEDDEDRVEKRNVSILQAHASGYCCVHSLHIVCLIYILAKLPLYSSPYTSDTCYRTYVQNDLTENNNLWYMPLCTWALASVYEVMSLVLERRRKDILLFGFTNNGILHTIFRGFMLIIGFWMFYLGLGIGNHMFYPWNTRIFDSSTSTSACPT